MTLTAQELFDITQRFNFWDKITLFQEHGTIFANSGTRLYKLGAEATARVFETNLQRDWIQIKE